MVIVSLVILAVSIGCFIQAMRGVREGQEDDGGFHDAGTASPYAGSTTPFR